MPSDIRMMARLVKTNPCYRCQPRFPQNLNPPSMREAVKKYQVWDLYWGDSDRPEVIFEEVFGHRDCSKELLYLVYVTFQAYKKAIDVDFMKRYNGGDVTKEYVKNAIGMGDKPC